MSIYGYARVSDSSQARSGLGLAAQRVSIRRYCRDRGWRLTALFIDRAVPGTRALRRRPEGAMLTTTVRAGDHVVIPKLDRAWRSVRDCAETLDGWRQHGVHAHLLDLGISTTTPAGRAHDRRDGGDCAVGGPADRRAERGSEGRSARPASPHESADLDRVASRT
jgi:DNA invertase Pin-like site-specific DNA recombinase